MEKVYVILNVLFITLYLISIVFVLAGNVFRKRYDDFKTKRLSLCLLLASLMLLCNLVNDGNTSAGLPFSQLLILIPLLLLTSSLMTRRLMTLTVVSVSFVEVVFAIMNLLMGADVMEPFPPLFYILGTGVLAIFLVIAIELVLWRRLRSVKAVMKSGSVWNFVCVLVDSAYYGAAFINVLVFLMFCGSCMVLLNIAAAASSVLLTLLQLALVYRLVTDRLLIFNYNMEITIIESMNEPQMEPTNDVSRLDTTYSAIYERVVAYFEEDLPYLNSALVIDDLVRVIYANKLYISRAISMFAGRNFCQFVNYYRVRHSVDLFRSNPELKVADLALMCGFNSPVSYTMAFKLFMNESPSDWMRRERNSQVRRRHKE